MTSRHNEPTALLFFVNHQNSKTAHLEQVWKENNIKNSTMLTRWQIIMLHIFHSFSLFDDDVVVPSFVMIKDEAGNGKKKRNTKDTAVMVIQVLVSLSHAAISND